MTLTTLVALAQITAPVIAAIAAVASWRSASASLRTAARADETTRRATEALSRANGPVLELVLTLAGGGPEGLGAVHLYIGAVNQGPRAGVLTAARVERSDGFRAEAGASFPMDIGPYGAQSDPPAARVVQVGPMEAFERPSGDKELRSPHVLTGTVEFTDAAGLVQWRQSIAVRERWGRYELPANQPGDTTYTYQLAPVSASPATIVGEPLAVEERTRWRRRRRR